MARSLKGTLSLAISCLTLFNASTANAQAGFQSLGQLPGGNWSNALAISGDNALRWTGDEVMAGLVDLPGESFSSIASGVSADDSVMTAMGGFTSGLEDLCWRADRPLVSLNNGTSYIISSGAYGFYANRSVITGGSDFYLADPFANIETIRRTSNDGLVGLSDLPGSHFPAGLRLFPPTAR